MKKTARQLDAEIAGALTDVGEGLRDEQIKAASKERRAADKLLARFKALDQKREHANADLRVAARQSDDVNRAEESGRKVEGPRKKAAQQQLVRAVRAEQALTNKMRDLVLKIRAIDPARVPWGWQNTR